MRGFKSAISVTNTQNNFDDTTVETIASGIQRHSKQSTLSATMLQCNEVYQKQAAWTAAKETPVTRFR
jgi:hypothetical protein